MNFELPRPAKAASAPAKFARVAPACVPTESRQRLNLPFQTASQLKQMQPHMERVRLPGRIAQRVCAAMRKQHANCGRFAAEQRDFARPTCVPDSPHRLEHLLNLRSFWPI